MRKAYKLKSLSRRPASAVFTDRSGVALVLVIWVLTLLMVISGEFSRAMRTETNISRNFRDGMQAYYAAVGGLNLAIYQLLTLTQPGVPSTPALEASQEKASIRWRINASMPTVPVGSGTASLRIDNESGKVNINLAGEGLLRLLVDGFNLDDMEKNTIVDAILDWRDADDLHRLNGAENDFYRSLPAPHACKNGDFDTVDELLMVKGVTPDLFNGGLSRMVTVYPGRAYMVRSQGWHEGQQRPEGVFDYDRINVNAASPELLWILFGGDKDAVDALIAARSENDVTLDTTLSTIIGTENYTRARNYLTDDFSPYYRIRAIGAPPQGEARRAVAAIVQVNAKAESPYQIVQWMDALPSHTGPQNDIGAAAGSDS